MGPSAFEAKPSNRDGGRGPTRDWVCPNAVIRSGHDCARSACRSTVRTEQKPRRGLTVGSTVSTPEPEPRREFHADMPFSRDVVHIRSTKATNKPATQARRDMRLRFGHWCLGGGWGPSALGIVMGRPIMWSRVRVSAGSSLFGLESGLGCFDVDDGDWFFVCVCAGLRKGSGFAEFRAGFSMDCGQR